MVSCPRFLLSRTRGAILIAHARVPKACIIFNVTPDSLIVDASSGSAYFAVSSNIDWNVTEDAEWLITTKVDRDSIKVLYDKNNSEDNRRATITITGEGGPTKDVAVIQKGDTATGIPPVIKDFSALVFPNPFKNNIVIQFDTIIFADVMISIIDNVGRLVYFNKFPNILESGRISLDLPSVRPGFYFLRIGIKNIWKTFKIVKV